MFFPHLSPGQPVHKKRKIRQCNHQVSPTDKPDLTGFFRDMADLCKIVELRPDFVPDLFQLLVPITVRMHRTADVPLHEVVRMASLTPAERAGVESEVGSLEIDKRADVLILNRRLQVKQVFIEAKRLGLA